MPEVLVVRYRKEELPEYRWCSAGPRRMISAEKKIRYWFDERALSSSVAHSRMLNLHWVYKAVSAIFPLWTHQYKNNRFCRMQQQLLRCLTTVLLQLARDRIAVNWIENHCVKGDMWPHYLSKMKTRTENMINIWIPIEKQNAAVEDCGTSSKRYIFSLIMLLIRASSD